MNDQRLDQLIRASLEWQAGSAAATHPALRTSAHRLAAHLGPDAATLRPRFVARPATNSAAILFLLALLLTAVLAVAVAVGALMLRLPPVPPGPFGFAGPCLFEAEDPTALLDVGSDANEDEPRFPVLSLGGERITDLSVRGSTFSSSVRGSVYTRRRLSPHGRLGTSGPSRRTAR